MVVTDVRSNHSVFINVLSLLHTPTTLRSSGLSSHSSAFEMVRVKLKVVWGLLAAQVSTILPERSVPLTPDVMSLEEARTFQCVVKSLRVQ